MRLAALRDGCGSASRTRPCEPGAREGPAPQHVPPRPPYSRGRRPLPHVARPCPERPYGLAPRGCAPTGDVVPCFRPRRPPRSSVVLVSPRIAACVGTARALLPLRLGREPAARPRAERGRLVPVDERHRMVVGRRPVRRRLRSGIRDERRVLGVRHGRSSELERVDLHDVVLVLRTTSDRIHAGWDVDPVEDGCLVDGDDAEPDVRITRRRLDRQSSRAPELVGAAQVRAAADRVTARPLPDIPGHVQRTERRGARRMEARLRRCADARREGRATPVGKLVSPRPQPVVGASGGGLPLVLGRQPDALALAERLRLGTRDVGDGPLSPPSPWKRAFVTGRREIRNASSDTSRLGHSSSSGGNAPAGSRPILNGPAGTGSQSIVAAAAPAEPAPPLLGGSAESTPLTPVSPAARPRRRRPSARRRPSCVWRPIGSPVFGLRSRRGKFDEDTSMRTRCPARRGSRWEARGS